MTNQRLKEIYKELVQMPEHKPLKFPIDKWTFTYKINDNDTTSNIARTSLHLIPLVGNSDTLRHILISEFGIKEPLRTMYSGENRPMITFTNKEYDRLSQEIEDEC